MQAELEESALFDSDDEDIHKEAPGKASWRAGISGLISGILPVSIKGTPDSRLATLNHENHPHSFSPCLLEHPSPDGLKK